MRLGGIQAFVMANYIYGITYRMTQKGGRGWKLLRKLSVRTRAVH